MVLALNIRVVLSLQKVVVGTGIWVYPSTCPYGYYDWQFSRDASFKVANHVDVPHYFQISQPWVAPSAGEKAVCSHGDRHLG